jgi:hypothetical protein
MVFDLIAMACVGAGVAGVFFFLRKIFKDRLAKWALPAVIGGGMLVFSVWNEYTWFGRATAALPEEVIVLISPQDRSAIRPWTYLFPVTSRYMALDRTSMLVSTQNPDIRQMEMMVVQRWTPSRRVPMAFDCAAGRYASLTEGVALAPDGTLSGGEWKLALSEDPMQDAACRGG